MTWCVAWAEFLADGTRGPRMWCATKNGRQPRSDTKQVTTRCGHVVLFPTGIEDRVEPTCGDCLARSPHETEGEPHEGE